MKRFGNFFNAAVKASAFMVAAVIAFSSCEKKPDPSVTVNQTEITAEPAGESFDVTVNANVAWTAEAQDKWVTVSPAEGVAGETKVTVTVKKNNSEDARETSVTFAGEGAVATVAVKQFGKDVVSVDKKSYAATPAGGSDDVKVTSNTDWTATADADWVTVTPASGAAGETAATVTVAPNAAAEAREAKVTFVAGDAKAEYTVSQEAISVAVSHTSVNVAGEGADVTVTVTANAAWTATSSAEWVTVAPAEGEAGAVEVTVTAAANETEADRTATVTFAVNENVKVELAVSQAFVKPTGKVVITVPAVTSSTADIVCTPDPLEGFTYYWDVLPKETADMLLPTDQDIIDYWVNYVNELLATYEGVYTWADLVSEGIDTYTYTGLNANTDYYVVAFGVDASGNVTSGLFKTEFKTADVNPALKEWIGTWTLTASDTYQSTKAGEQGLTGKPATKTITIGTDSVFELELGESDLVVAGLSYTDDLPLYTYTSTGEPIPMETVGTVDGNGNLKLVNGQEVMEYGDYGMITWIGNSYVMEDWYMINGSYAPFTLKFGADKTTATGTPYSGKLSNGESFTTAYYDIKLVSGSGASSFYTDDTSGALAGTWTLTKVVEETQAASKSLVKVSKAEKAIRANEKKANYMKTFNSKALFAL